MRIAKVEWSGRELWAEFADGIAYEIEGPGGSQTRGVELGPIEQARLLAPMEPYNKIVKGQVCGSSRTIASFPPSPIFAGPRRSKMSMHLPLRRS